MDQAKNNKSLLLGVPGILIQFFGVMGAGIVQALLNTSPESTLAFVIAIWLIGTAMLIGGLIYYAQAKGQSGWWGLIGFLGLIGLIVLGLLPDRHGRGQRLATISERVSDIPTSNSLVFQCPSCKYRLNGITTGACPECGRAFIDDDLSTVEVVGLDRGTAPWMGRWSLIAGIFGILLSCLAVCGPPLGIISIIFGHLALNEIKKSDRPGRGVALAGTIIGYVVIVMSVALFFFMGMR